MELFSDFFLLQDPNVRWVVLAVMLMSASAAIVGCFTYLRKRALIGDAVAHAILPGICLAFLFWGTKNPLVLLIGAFISGWFSLIVMDFIAQHSKLKNDAIIALVLSVFYGFGIMLLTMIQGAGNAAQSGLDKFLFGNAAALMQEDVIIFAAFSLLLLLVVGVLFNSFQLVVFDRQFAQAKGLPVRRLELLLSSLTVMAIATGIQTVGVVLMAALLITPSAAARYWTENLRLMMILAAFFAALSSLAGTFVSYAMPKMPTGPWIVTVLSVLAIFSVLFGRKRGVVYAWLHSRKNERKMLKENLLKCLYHLGEADGYHFERQRTIQDIQAKRAFATNELKDGLHLLVRGGWVVKSADKVMMTEKGVAEGRRVTRIHRLWELYLTSYMQLPSDHVHDDAEAMEHIITPELEQELMHQLQHPVLDPHATPIPYQQAMDRVPNR